MKKLYLLLVALMGMTSVHADDTYCFTQSGDTTYTIPISDMTDIYSAFVEAGGTAYDWGYYCLQYVTDQVMYANDYLTIASATDQGYVYFTTPSKKSNVEENTGEDLSDCGYISLGSTLSQHIYAEDGTNDSGEAVTKTTITFSEEEINASSLESSWQSTLVVTPNVSGHLGFKVACTNARSIAIFKVPTLSEYNDEFYEGEWLAINDFDSDSGCPAEVYADVEAGRQYYIIAGSNNVQMYQISFNPYEEPSEETSDVYCFTQSGDTTYTIPISEMSDIYSAFVEAGGTAYDWGYYCLQYVTDQVMYANDYFTIASATDQGYVYFTTPSKKSNVEENTGEDLSDCGYISLGSTLSQHIYAEDGTNDSGEAVTKTTITFSEEEINASSLESSWQSTLVVTPAVAGQLGFKVACTNARSIAIFKVPTLSEYNDEFYEGEWLAINDFDSDSGCPAEVYAEVEADRQYYIIAGSNNVQMYQISFNPGESTGISEVTTTTDNVGDGKIYTIDGRCMGVSMDNLTRGIYIINGKKFVIK